MIESLFYLLVISVIVSLFAHALIHSFFLSFIVACAVSAPVSAVLFQVFLYFQSGHVEKYGLIVFMTTTPIAFVYAAVIGLMIRQQMKRQENPR